MRNELRGGVLATHAFDLQRREVGGGREADELIDEGCH